MRLYSRGLGTILGTSLVLQILPGQTPVTRPRLERFRYERTIIPGGPGPNRLSIDVPLLAGAMPFAQFSRENSGGERGHAVIAEGGLSDLRIYDASNREVAYLLVEPPPPEHKWSEGRLLVVASTKKASGFEVDLGHPLLVDRFRLGGLAPPFLKRFRLEGSGDRNRWTLLVPEGTLFDLPAEKLNGLEAEFESGQYRYFRLTWDDASSARVGLPGSASARLVTAGAPAPAVRAQLQFERRGSEPGMSRYRLRLPGPRLPVLAIEITSPEENILRQAQISEGRLAEGHVLPHELGSATLRRATRGGVAAAEMRIPIGSPTEAQLELTIADGNNPALEIKGVTAVFAYLPWIYFESPGRDLLTARFGYPNVAAPQYDLEAMRGSIAKVRTVEARWGELRERPRALENSASARVTEAGAPVNVTSFRFSRTIRAAGPGLNAVLLDATVLAHSNLSDLRMTGPDGRQIPYLMEVLDEPLSVELPNLERTEAPIKQTPSSARSLSYYRLKVPYEGLPPSRLVLTTSSRVFQRYVFILLEKNPANGRQEPWTMQVGNANWSHADPETPVPALTLALPPLKGDARVVVEEGDNSPLPITSAKLLLPAYRLRFFRETENLMLYYGLSDLEAPHYDLALLAPRLVGAAAEEISMGPERASATAGRTQQMQMKFFWAILVAAVVALSILIARLIRKREPGN